MLNKYVDYFIVNLDLLTYAGNLETLIEIQDSSNYKFVKGDIQIGNRCISYLKKKGLI